VLKSQACVCGRACVRAYCDVVVVVEEEEEEEEEEDNEG
jgi:hypothetical protein